MKLGRVRIAVAAALAIVGLMPGAGGAMEFSIVKVPDSEVTVIAASGAVRSGDAERLTAARIAVPRDQFTFVSLNSDGGNIVAAESVASVIQRHKLPVFVAHNSRCASACFLIFAASRGKFFEPGALIGVHSASVNARESMDSMAMTTAMARSASDLGVPPGVIGKMVTTAPGNMAWLSAGELAAMGAKQLDVPASQPRRYAQPAPLPDSPDTLARVPPSATPGQPPVRSASRTIPADDQSPSFQQGRADRTTWEQWFATLTGDARLGAEYWTGERSKQRPGNCVGTPEFQQSCLTARQRLAGPDTRRKTDPQYWWGWNSL